MAAPSSKTRMMMVQPRLARRGTLLPSVGPQHHLVSDTASSVISPTHTNSATAPRRNAQYENTYKMAPTDEKMFASGRVTAVMRNVLASYLGDCQYEPHKCSRLSRDLSSLIKSQIREMDFERYKIVCTLSIVENKGQDMEITSGFVWNTKTDNYATATYKNKDIFAVATVYGLYMD